MQLAERLERHLADWLGAWPPAGELTIVGSEHRTRPGWDGKVYPVAGVATPDGAVLSVPPDRVEAAYRRTTFYDQRVQLMEQWAGFLLPPVADGNVIPIARVG